MITNRVIQKWWDKANSSGTDVMRWSDFLDCMTELRNTDTTVYTENNINLNDLPEYDDEAAAVLGGLSGGDLYKTGTGEIRIKLPDL